MLRVGINGLGRIGRAVARINAERNVFDLVGINDIEDDIENMAYLLRYDSVYGRAKFPVGADVDHIVIDGKPVRYYREDSTDKIPWDVDVIIDSSGIYSNVIAAHDVDPKVIITYSPPGFIDKTVVLGVNEREYDPKQHHVISASICDVNGALPILNHLHNEFGIESGFVTTLHPWLGYQNLMDGTVRSISSPGHKWRDYSLGRASTPSLIPKQTTLVPAISRVVPSLSQRLSAMSFRVPTGIVSASDMTLQLSYPVTAQDINTSLRSFAARHPGVIGFSEEPLVSIDYAGSRESCWIDSRWTQVDSNGVAKLVSFYDNEWGFANRVVDLVALIELG